MLLGHAWVGVKNTKKSGTRPAEESGHDISVYESGHDISVHATCRRPGRGGGARSECKRGGCPCMMLAGRGVGRGGRMAGGQGQSASRACAHAKLAAWAGRRVAARSDCYRGRPSWGSLLTGHAGGRVEGGIPPTTQVLLAYQHLCYSQSCYGPCYGPCHSLALPVCWCRW